jgi:hypothetical protein
MDLITLLGFAWLSLSAWIMIRVLSNQFKLLSLYREQIKPPYQVVPGEKLNVPRDTKSDNRKDPFGIIIGRRWIQIMFSKHIDHPDLAKLAKKVRMGLVQFVIVAVGGFILLAALIFADTSV